MVAKLDGTNGLIQQYDYQAPSTGFSYTFAAGVQVLVMQPAGTLATGTITMPASPADGMTVTFSSTQAITALTVNANTSQSIVGKPTSFGIGSAATFVYRLSNTTWYPTSAYANSAIPKSSLPTGSVLQVVSTTKTDTFSSTTTGAFTDITSFSVSITPTSSSSKILVLYVAEIGLSTTVNTMLLRLMRDSTAINIGNTNGSRSQATTSQQTLYSNTNNTSRTISGNFLDSPATTSSITYKIQFRNSSGTFYLNRDGEYGDNTTNATGASTITVMEIAA